MATHHYFHKETLFNQKARIWNDDSQQATASELEGTDVGDLWFQQGCATGRAADDTINVLKETFGERIASWSCDSIPLDYFNGVMWSQ